MPQNPLQYLPAQRGGVPKPLTVDAAGNLVSAPAQNGGVAKTLSVDAQGNLLVGKGSLSVLNIAAATVVKATPGRVAKVSVNVAGAVGTLSDVATTGAVAAGNLIWVIPAAVGVYDLDWPCAVGIVVTPGAAQVVSISYD